MWNQPHHSPGPVSSETRLPELSPGRASRCGPRGHTPKTQQAAPGRRVQEALVLASRLLIARGRPSARAPGRPGGWDVLLGPGTAPCSDRVAVGRGRGPSDPSPEEASISRRAVRGRQLCPCCGTRVTASVDGRPSPSGHGGALWVPRPQREGCLGLPPPPHLSQPLVHIRSPVPSRWPLNPVTIFSEPHSVWMLHTDEGGRRPCWARAASPDLG